MNDDSLTPEELLAITSPQPHPGPALGREEAELREAFLQLGQLAEQAGGAFDEAAALARLTERCLAAAPQPVAKSRWPSREWWTPVIGAALAAAAVVAVVRTVATWPARERTAIVISAPQLPQPDVAPASEPPAAPQLAWSDALDREIASAQAAVEQLGRPAGLDGSLDNLDSRLRALSAEIESGSL